MSDKYVYWQPMNFPDTVKNFEIKVTVHKVDSKPVENDSNLVDFHFKEYKNSFIAHEKISGLLIQKPISFEIPAQELVNKVFVEEIPNTNSVYFYTCLQPEKTINEKPDIDKLGIVWDISASASNRDIQKEMEVLDAYFKTTKNLKVELIPFANQIFKSEQYLVKNGNWDALKNRLAKLINDGGTQMGCIDFRKYDANEFFMFSDGITNFGKEFPEFSKIPVTSIVTSISADYSFLKYIAQKTNGNFINASTLSADQIVNKLRSNPFRFIGSSNVSGNSFDIYPSIPTDFNRSFIVSGKMKGRNSEIRLDFGTGSNIKKSFNIDIERGNRVSTGTISKVWAEKKIEELDMFPEQNINEITALGLKYSIITRNTSLLVLDRLEDYIEYHILPPAGKIRNEYLANVSKEEKDEKKEKEDHLKEVIQMFNERLTWWNTKFEIPKYEKPEKKEPDEIVRYLNDAVVADGGLDGTSTASDSTVVSSEQMWGFGSGDGAALEESRSYHFSANVGFLVDNTTAVTNYTAPGTYSVSLSTESEENSVDADIDIKTWVPDAAYIKPLKNASKDKVYQVYLQLKSKNKETPAYYFDAADILLQKGLKTEALRVLSNIAELELENHELLRTLAHRLQQLKKYELAICVFKEVLKIREEEPQSYRDLGLAFAENHQYQDAINNLCKVINTKWDGRFPEIELICIGEVNRIIALSPKPLDLKNFEKQFQKNLPVNIRVVIDWDSDNCDMDLWVTDPTGEKTYYSNPKSRIGGRISRDFTGGYGPEEFIIKKAMPGNYRIEVDYFGSSRQTISGPTTVQAKLITGYGSTNEKTQEVTIRLKQAKEVIKIGNLIFK